MSSMRAREFPPGYGSSATSGLKEMVPALGRVGSHCDGRLISTLVLRGSFYVGIVRTPLTRHGRVVFDGRSWTWRSITKGGVHP